MTSRYGILLLVTLLFPFQSFALANDTTMISSVLKIKTYERNSIDGNYSMSHYGSAVLIDGKRIVTNAHVILDSDNAKPTGYYEVCRSDPKKKIPICFSTATLISYDKVADLAVLELGTPVKNTKPITFSSVKNLSIATNVIVYGFPAIGGLSITRTEGKIGGFDKENYKFDGTIDHGNSGGGAFDFEGKLVGIPYAVSSDNGVIGYIIPIATLQDFLAKKTDNIELFTTKIQSSFASYIRSNQALTLKGNLLKTNFVEIKDAEKNGFTLSSAVASVDGSIFTYKFFDKNTRVGFILGCYKIARTTEVDPVDYSKKIIESLLKQKDVSSIATGSFLDDKKTIFSIDVVAKKEVKGSKAVSKIISYKNAPNCSVMILSEDGDNKDKTSFAKAVTLAKNVKFFQPGMISSSINSKFYSLNSVPEDFNFIEGAAFINGSDIYPSISYIPSDSLESIISEFELFEFDDVGGIMEYASSESKSYSDSSYTFQTFFDTYKTMGYYNIVDTAITTKSGKKLIMTISDYSDTDVFPAKYEKNVTFFYPFVTAQGEYYAYKMKFTLHTNNEDYIFDIRKLIESIEFPGTSPFKNL